MGRASLATDEVAPRSSPVDSRPVLRGGVADLGSLLDLEALDHDRFRGGNADHGEALPSIYGGQLAAQALRAASHTVEPGRMPHSFHAYYVRPSRPDVPVVYAVERLRDGASMSAREVRGIQGGAVVLSMLASFKYRECTPEFVDALARVAPAPESLPANGWDDLVDAREVSWGDHAGHTVADLLWCRVTTPLPDDDVVHACALAYLSDLGGGFNRVDVAGIPCGGPSIDHVLRFHAPVRVDDWVLIDHRPERASDARGSYTGTLTTRRGALAGVVNQELLLR